MMPWASALWACDSVWWDRNRELWRGFKGLKFTWDQSAAKRWNLIYAKGKAGKGLGTNTLHAGGSGGYMAVNLAYFLGASEICLLGYDMQFTDGKSHWHGDHTKTGNPSKNDMEIWAKRFSLMQEDLQRIGIPLVNCTRETALTIPRKPLEAVIDECA